MRKKGENNVKPLRAKLRSARRNNDFTLGVESQPRPSQDKLLGALCLGFFEDERDACESLWLIED
jgi:hypothetical protein